MNNIQFNKKNISYVQPRSGFEPSHQPVVRMAVLRCNHETTESWEVDQ